MAEEEQAETVKRDSSEVLVVQERAAGDRGGTALEGTGAAVPAAIPQR